MGEAAPVLEDYRLSQGARLHVVEVAPSVTVIPDTPEDAFDRKRAEQLVRSASLVGAVAVKQSVDKTETQATPETGSAYPSLLHAIRAAAEGDPIARKLVQTDIRTHAIELTIKAGMIMDIPLTVNENGQLMQYGQLLEDVYKNALVFASAHPVIRRRSEAEIRNGMRMESQRRRGNLRENYFVVVSRYTDYMDDKSAREEGGFFPDTKSCSIQVISEEADGTLTQESAFVAGVAELNGPRHDKEAVVAMGKALGVDWDKDDIETLDIPVLVPRSMMPNGVIDLVRLYDQGKTFFGESKAVQDYVTYRQKCLEREASFEPMVQQIFDKLMAQHDTLVDPDDATERMHKITEQEMVDLSIEDTTINPRVFGEVAAAHIVEARYWMEQGDLTRLNEARNKAVSTAASTSCPNARALKSGEALGGQDQNGQQADAAEEHCSEIKNGQWVRCPGCKQHVKAIVPDRESVYCSNRVCKFAPAYLRSKPAPAPKTESRGVNAPIIRLPLPAWQSAVSAATQKAA